VTRRDAKCHSDLVRVEQRCALSRSGGRVRSRCAHDPPVGTKLDSQLLKAAQRTRLGQHPGQSAGCVERRQHVRVRTASVHDLLSTRNELSIR
jgi:hypothetical protein